MSVFGLRPPVCALENHHVIMIIPMLTQSESDENLSPYSEKYVVECSRFLPLPALLCYLSASAAHPPAHSVGFVMEQIAKNFPKNSTPTQRKTNPKKTSKRKNQKEKINPRY